MLCRGALLCCAGEPSYAASPAAYLGAAILLSFYIVEEVQYHRLVGPWGRCRVVGPWGRCRLVGPWDTRDRDVSTICYHATNPPHLPYSSLYTCSMLPSPRPNPSIRPNPSPRPNPSSCFRPQSTSLPRWLCTGWGTARAPPSITASTTPLLRRFGVRIMARGIALSQPPSSPAPLQPCTPSWNQLLLLASTG